MTINEIIQNKEMFLKAANEAATKYNEARNEKDLDAMEDAMDKIEKSVKDYANMARSLTIQECLATENPMVEATKRWAYKVIKAKEIRIDPMTKDTKLVIDTVVQPIDFLKIQKLTENAFGHDTRWVFMIEYFNRLMAIRRCEELGVDSTNLKNDYFMHEAAKSIDFGKNPVCNKNILHTIQTIIDAMLGEGYAVEAFDVEAVITNYSKFSRKEALKVALSGHKQLTDIFARICNRLVTGGSYEVEYKKAKK